MPLEHQPVLLKEVVEGLKINPCGTYIDATFGRGGHSLAILKKLGSVGRLVAIDKDPRAIEVAQTGPFRDPRFLAIQASFSELGFIVKDLGLHGKINGIVMDLGVSSPQLDDPDRGFSFLRDGPLDMRMNPEEGITASDWLNRVSEKELSDVLKEYGEERFARRIAKAIIKKRQECLLVRTTQLAEVIAKAVPIKEKGKHPATRSFQAIRIYINQELEEIKTGLKDGLEMLAKEGRLCVISFHSLEDRMVKNFIRENARGVDLPREIPIIATKMNQRLRKVGGLITPSFEEITENPRARSARLRIAEKL